VWAPFVHEGVTTADQRSWLVHSLAGEARDFSLPLELGDRDFRSHVSKCKHVHFSHKMSVNGVAAWMGIEGDYGPSRSGLLL
jgi:hypothetical protein